MTMHVGIVGAGLAGLAAAVELTGNGHQVTVFEQSDGVGGRVRTDNQDGFLLDRGFQILLTAYPDCQELFDYDQLDLRPFTPGALVHFDGKLHRISDPLRDPKGLPSTLISPVGSALDKARILSLRLGVSRGTVDDLWSGVGTTAMHRFETAGFSPAMIRRFLQPLFSGITLEPELLGTSQAVEFVFRMLASGDSAVPAKGMGQLTTQLAARLPADTVVLNAEVDDVTSSSISVIGGDSTTFDRVLVAADADAAEKLVGTPNPGWNGVTTVWYEAPQSPVKEPALVLNGQGSGAINSLAPLSLVSSDYAPSGRALFAVSAPTTDPDLPRHFDAQLQEWFGAAAEEFSQVRVDRIEKAQPRQLPGHDARPPLSVDGIWLAGDHRRDASINGAVASGRAAARALLADSVSAGDGD